MTTLSRANSERKYSWWWDSHISPKNSKWLQENLTDMDAKVKAMIKVIEEDADSFARRAEMYYKKRPELMKLVEEFYRTYRALAERYDYATGVLRQAHRTMAEAFPNQVPLMLPDDSPASYPLEADPCTPEMSRPKRALFDPDDLQKDSSELSSSPFHADQKNGAFTEESDSMTSGMGLKQFNDIFGSGGHVKFAEGRVRKGLNFHDMEEKEQSNQNNENHNLEARVQSESKQVGELEKEILILKEALAKLEAEKEAGLIQYQQSSERLSKLESEVSHAQVDSRGLNERATQSEADVQNMKEALSKLEAEKVASLLRYQQCLDRISNLENILSRVQEDAEVLNDRTSKAENEAHSLKQDLAIVEAEKDDALDRYKESLKMISDQENKLQHAEEDARQFSERADRAEKEVGTLKQAFAKLTEDKETAALQYQLCLETISSLEHKIYFSQEEAQRLNGEIDNGVAKLKDAEERCLLLERSNQFLHSELESLMLKMSTHSQELTEKQKELGRLWTCVQEERLRFVEAETAFQTLQHLHSQAQEELRSLASELQNRAQILRDIETHNQSLQDEVLKVKEQNRSLNELNLSSAISMKDVQNEIFNLRETKGKLEEEVELRVDQRNALQQEIYCLKETFNELNNRHQAIIEQVDAVGLNPECLELSVKQLQDENSNLKETCQRGRSEKVALLEKLEILEQLLEKNALLENSVSDLCAELEGVRRKIKALEASCGSLLQEKSTLVDEKASLITQLQATTENLEKLSEKNNVLENSLSDVQVELEGLKADSKSLDDSFQLLVNQKSGLASEKDTLISQLEATQQRLQDLEKRYKELDLAVEKGKESTLRKIEELQVSLEIEKQGHATFVQMTETRLAGMESHIFHLQEEGQHRKREFEEELDRGLALQIEIFVLQNCAQDLEEKNFCLLIECQKLLEASKLSEKLMSDLEQHNLEQQIEVKSLSDQTNNWRAGLCKLLKALDIVLDEGSEEKIGQDQIYLNPILSKLEDRKISLSKTEEENQQLVVEMSVLVTLLGQLRSKAENLKMEKNIIDQEFTIKTEQLSVMQSEALKLHEMNEELNIKLTEGDITEGLLRAQMENLHRKLLVVQGAYQNLRRQNSEGLEEKRSLTKEFLNLEEKNHSLEEENDLIHNEMLYLGNLSLIFVNYVNEKSMELKELGGDLDKLHGVNEALTGKLSLTQSRLEEVQVENMDLKEILHNSEDALKTITVARDQLSYESENRKGCLVEKEMQLLEVEQKLIVTEKEKTELQNILKDLNREYDEVKLIREDQEKQTLKLSEDNNHMRMENRCLCEASKKLEVELQRLHEEHEATKTQMETLRSELQEEKDEIDIWETQAAAFFDELQISTICQALFEGKVHELSEAFESLEAESTPKDMDIKLLKERVGILEGENEGLKAQLAAYGEAVISLRDCLSSLENHTCLHAKLLKPENMEMKDAELVNHLCEDQNATVPNALPGLQDLKTRIRAVEKAMIEVEQLVMQENLNVSTKLEAALRQIEELKSEGSLRRNIKPVSEICEAENGLLTKDIMLDHISECSSHGISRREDVEVDNQMLELWETADKDGSIDLTVGKAKKVTAPTKKDIDFHRVESVKKQKSEYPISDVLVEKELGVDKLEISKRSMEPRQEGNKRKMLERLNSDVQKLTNLQITVQDLKRKLEIIEKSKRGKAIDECDILKGQLEEAEEAILKFFDHNSKLMKNIENDPFSSGGKSSMESEESGSVRRRKVSEQARRVSEKIGRLQLEIQKIQFVLLKLDDENESRGRSRFSDTKRRVLLRDYLYSGVRTSHRQKKTPFCACVQPPTKGD